MTDHLGQLGVPRRWTLYDQAESPGARLFKRCDDCGLTRLLDVIEGEPRLCDACRDERSYQAERSSRPVGADRESTPRGPSV